MAATYKSSGTPGATIWNPVDENATIQQIENRFANNSADAYLSESEICTVPLVPLGQASDNVADTQAALDSFWNGPSYAGGLTGDNLRELPYAQLYSRLTTRSNSYTVHVRVQVLKKLTERSEPECLERGHRLVLGDWRGSYEIERYLDPAAAAPSRRTAAGAVQISHRQLAAICAVEWTYGTYRTCDGGTSHTSYSSYKSHGQLAFYLQSFAL